MEKFVDGGHEVCKGTDWSKGRQVARTVETAEGGEQESGFDDFNGDLAGLKFDCQTSVGGPIASRGVRELEVEAKDGFCKVWVCSHFFLRLAAISCSLS